MSPVRARLTLVPTALVGMKVGVLPISIFLWRMNQERFMRPFFPAGSSRIPYPCNLSDQTARIYR